MRLALGETELDENEILKRRLFGPRTERSGTSELPLSLGDLLKQQEELQKKLDEAVRKSRAEDPDAAASGDDAMPPKDKRARRDRSATPGSAPVGAVYRNLLKPRISPAFS